MPWTVYSVHFVWFVLCLYFLFIYLFCSVGLHSVFCGVCVLWVCVLSHLSFVGFMFGGFCVLWILHSGILLLCSLKAYEAEV